MEPNAVPGFTNRAIARFVSRALISLSGDGALLPARADRDHRTAGARGVFSDRAEAEGRGVEPADHRRQPGIAHVEPGGARRAGRCSAKRGLPVRIVHQTGAAGSRRCATSLRSPASTGEVVPFHHRHAGGVRGGRPGDLPLRRRGGVGTGGGGQAVGPGAVSLRGGRSSDPQCGGDAAGRRGPAGRGTRK